MDVPLGTVHDSQLMIPTSDVPVFAMVNGEKVEVGRGHIHPDTMIFTTKLNGSPAAELALEHLREHGETAGFVSVSGVVFQHPVDEPKED